MPLLQLAGIIAIVVAGYLAGVDKPPSTWAWFLSFGVIASSGGIWAGGAHTRDR